MAKITCLAPWVHGFATNKLKGLCCIAGNMQPFESHSEFWNGDYMRKVRTQFMAGETIPECSLCFEHSNREEENRYYQVFDRDYGHLVDDIKASTNAETGTTTFQPVYLDYRHSLCNLKCKTCSSHSSSSIASTSRMIPIVPYKSVFGEHLSDLKAIITDKTQKIYWAGGEPLMSPVHWEILEYMKDKQFFNTHMTYNTNATKLTNDEIFDQAVNYFKMFNSHVGISIDGIGVINDYIRAGSNWKSIDTTIKKLLDALGRHAISLDITITNLTFLQLPDILQYAIDTGLEHCYFKNMIEFGGDIHDGQVYDDNTYLSIGLITPTTFNTISNAVIAILANSTLQTNIRSLLVFIQNRCIGREFTDHERQAIMNFEQRHNDTLSLYDIVRHQRLPGDVGNKI